MNHIKSTTERWGTITLPLCGRANWDDGSLVTDPDDNECWECASIAGHYAPALMAKWGLELDGRINLRSHVHHVNCLLSVTQTEESLFKARYDGRTVEVTKQIEILDNKLDAWYCEDHDQELDPPPDDTIEWN